MPTTTVQATPLPGKSLLTGIVTDTSVIFLADVDLIIPKLQKRATSAVDGTFRFEGVPAGTYSVRARKLGFAPQILEVKVGKDGGVATFSLLPLSRYLAPTVITATSGGLSGVVADTAYEPIPGAMVTVLGAALRTTTDSSGRFFLPVKPGSRLIQIAKNTYQERIIGVTIPSDSGRSVAVQLGPSLGPVPIQAVWNARDLALRLAWRDKLKEPYYTREDLKKIGFEWILDAVRIGGMAQYDADCHAVKNGGPGTVDISTLTVDDVEAIEIRNSARGGGPIARPSEKQRPPPMRASQAVTMAAGAAGMSNIREVGIENWGRFCPIVYVWLR